MSKKLKALNIKKLALILSIIAALAAIGAVIYAVWPNKGETAAEETASENNGRNTSEEDLSKEYVTECKYTGGIGYPEVYEHPFKRTDNYVTNKELWSRHPERMQPILEVTTAFANKVFNVNYKDVQANKQKWVDELVELLDPEFVYQEDFSTGEIKTAEDYAEILADTIIENEYIAEAEFISDESLIFEDVYNTIRGVLKYTVYSSQNDKIPADGKEKTAIIHIRANVSNNAVNKWYVAYGLTQEEMIFPIEN